MPSTNTTPCAGGPAGLGKRRNPSAMRTLLDQCGVETTVHVHGALRAPVNNELRRSVCALLSRGERQIRLDLAAVPDVDAAGVGEIVRVFNMARGASGTVRIAGAGRRVRQLLDLAGLLDRLEDGAPMKRVAS